MQENRSVVYQLKIMNLEEIVKGHLFGDAYGDFSENDSIYHIFSHLDKDTFLFKKGVKSNGVWSSGGAKYWYAVDIVDSEEDYDLDRNNKHDIVYYEDSYGDKYYCPIMIIVPLIQMILIDGIWVI